jgi:hypothetical protein
MAKFAIVGMAFVASTAAFAPGAMESSLAKFHAKRDGGKYVCNARSMHMGPLDNLPKPRNFFGNSKLPKIPELPSFEQEGTQTIGRGIPSSINEIVVSITDTSGALGGFKWILFFGASFLPSLFLAGYFLGGYYPPMAAGLASEEPSWWPTAMQYSHGVNKGTLAKNVAKVESKEKELKAAKDKLAAAKKAAKEAKKAAEKAAKDAAAAKAKEAPP